MQRYFTQHKDFILSNDDIYHITKVMRMKENDHIEVVYDKKVFLCKINKITDNNISISPIKELDQDHELAVDIILAIALIKEQKMDFILQKATELGVNEIIPLQLERSIIKINKNKEDNKLDRWRKICKEASEQSHRNLIPKIHRIMTLDEIDVDNSTLKLVASLSKEAINIKEILQKHQKCDKILIVIGPEGGITDKEEQELIKKGFTRMSLGNRVLRTETVPIYILSVLNYEFMR